MNESEQKLVDMAVEAYTKEREAYATYTINKLLNGIQFRVIRNNDTAMIVVDYEGKIFSTNSVPIEFMDKIPSDVQSPDWNKYEKIHNWRNHIPESIRGIWNTFTLYQKWILAREAQVKADEEEWE